MSDKRWREPKSKPNELLVKYGKSCGELDLFYCHDGEAHRCDSRLLSIAFEGTQIIGEGTLREQLEQRGYDITTLRFSIRKREAAT